MEIPVSSSSSLRTNSIIKIHNILKYPEIEHTEEVLQRIFYIIRRNLTYEQSAGLVSILPDEIEKIYLSNWGNHENKITLNHLDELVEAVRKENMIKYHPAFSTEISALTAILVVFKVLDDECQILSSGHFNFEFVVEVKSAMLGIQIS